jgi:hypothetical protein
MRTLTLSTLAGAMLIAYAAAPIHAKPGSGPGHRPAPCDASGCAVQLAVATACPCASASNHGQYVRCVAHEAKALAAGGMIGRNCRGRVVRLAAHSVCGRGESVVCLVPTSTCTANVCANDPNSPCMENADCGTQCSVKKAADCTAASGVASQAPNCASAGCFSPSGAFLDLQ